MSETPAPKEGVTQKILSFEEFTARTPSPKYNNLVLYFTTGENGEKFYRSQAHFQKFLEEHPELEKRLRIGIMSLNYFSGETFKPFDRDLYEAYKILRTYEGVSDGNLFA